MYRRSPASNSIVSGPACSGTWEGAARPSLYNRRLDVIIIFCDSCRRGRGEAGFRWQSQRDDEQRLGDEHAGEHQQAAGVAAGEVAQPAHRPQGRAQPPRLPIELISAMPAAAAVPPRNIGGIAQNTLDHRALADLRQA